MARITMYVEVGTGPGSTINDEIEVEISESMTSEEKESQMLAAASEWALENISLNYNISPF